MTDRDLFDQLDQLVNGPPVHCACGNEVDHYYMVLDQKLCQVLVLGGPQAIVHHIWAGGRVVLQFAIAPNGMLDWHAAPGMEIIL